MPDAALTTPQHHTPHNKQKNQPGPAPIRGSEVGGFPFRASGENHIGAGVSMSLREGLGLLGVALVAATILSHQRYSVRRACFPLHKEVHDGSLTSAIELLLADDMVPHFIFIHRLGMILNYRRQAARYASACTHLDTFS